MPMIILLIFFFSSLLFPFEAQEFDVGSTTLLVGELSSGGDLFSLGRSDSAPNELGVSTLLPSFNSIESDLPGSSSSLDLSTISPSIFEERWINVNESSRRDPLRSTLFWRFVPENGSYILSSHPRCLRQMCSVKLKYNGTLLLRKRGCLSFALQMRGQPVGQLWIVEDQQAENVSQNILFTNQSLRLEHSLRSNLKNLTIEARIFFRNATTDGIVLSNVQLDWSGSCRQGRRPIPTPSPGRDVQRSTLDDQWSSEGSSPWNTLSSDEDSQGTEPSDNWQLSTVPSVPSRRRSFSPLDRSNFGWFLSLVASLCLLMVLGTFAFGLWSIKRGHYYNLHVPFDSRIQFLARRSLRSSTRSEKPLATISDIAYDLMKQDSPLEQLDHTSQSNTSSSTATSYYTYL